MHIRRPNPAAKPYAYAQPFNRVRSITEHFFVILSQRKACAGRFREEAARKRTGPITRWLLRRLLFTCLESSLLPLLPNQTNASCSKSVSRRLMLLRSFNKSCFRVTAQMLPRLNGHFIYVLAWFCMYTKTTASAVSFGAILSFEI